MNSDSKSATFFNCSEMLLMLLMDSMKSINLEDLPFEIIVRIAETSPFVWWKLSITLREFGLWSIQPKVKEKNKARFRWLQFLMIISGRKRPRQMRKTLINTHVVTDLSVDAEAKCVQSIKRQKH